MKTGHKCFKCTSNSTCPTIGFEQAAQLPLAVVRTPCLLRSFESDPSIESNSLDSDACS